MDFDGLAFLLFLAGLEIDVRHFRGPRARLTGLALGLSALLALITGIVLHAAGVAQSPLLVGIILLATSLGLIVPILTDAGGPTALGPKLLLLLLLLLSLLVTGLGALATHLGFEAILGAFIAGAILRLIDPDAGHTHPLFHPKLDAAATTIGLQLHAINPANAAALIAAGLFSVIIFPVTALQLLRSPANHPSTIPEKADVG